MYGEMKSGKSFFTAKEITFNKGIPPIKPRKLDGTRLISEWYTVSAIKTSIINGHTMYDDFELQAYYHVLYGWMIKGEKDDVWKYGYHPINMEVIGWY